MFPRRSTLLRDIETITDDIERSDEHLRLLKEKHAKEDIEAQRDLLLVAVAILIALTTLIILFTRNSILNLA